MKEILLFLCMVTLAESASLIGDDPGPAFCEECRTILKDNFSCTPTLSKPNVECNVKGVSCDYLRLSINWSGFGIPYFPSSAWSFSNLQSIDLSYNSLDELPESSSVLKLTYVNLSHNDFSEVPKVLNTLHASTITSIDLSYNHLTAVLANDFPTPSRSCLLDISHNCLSTFGVNTGGNFVLNTSYNCLQFCASAPQICSADKQGDCSDDGGFCRNYPVTSSSSSSLSDSNASDWNQNSSSVSDSTGSNSSNSNSSGSTTNSSASSDSANTTSASSGSTTNSSASSDSANTTSASSGSTTNSSATSDSISTSSASSDSTSDSSSNSNNSGEDSRSSERLSSVLSSSTRSSEIKSSQTPDSSSTHRSSKAISASTDNSSAEGASLLWVYITAPIVAVALIAILLLFATPLRRKVFGACSGGAKKEDEEEEEGLFIKVDGVRKQLRLSKKIGKGSFGTVWLAEAGTLTLAAKEMARRYDDSESEFKKEMGIMSALDSKYVVRVYGSCETEESFYIAMEYVPLGSLSTAFRQYSFSSFMRARFMLDVARGMTYLHSQGVMHRDLKPGNVLVSSLDPNAAVLCKITDFGASRQGLEETSTMTMTCGIGSPYYMSPEMLRGDEKYTRAVDVYSFGIMCLELWNEQPPFAEAHFDTPFSFARYVIQGHRPAIRDDCPDNLAELFERCWESDRVNRPPFTEVVETLEPIVNDIKDSLPEGTVHVVRKRSHPAGEGNKDGGKGKTKKTDKPEEPKKKKSHHSSGDNDDHKGEHKKHKKHKKHNKESENDVPLDDL